VTTNDLRMELRGRIESGGGFGISVWVSDARELAGKERLDEEES
jgi:hypothetical protein